MYENDDGDEDEVMDIIEERERELKERKRQKALLRKKKELATASQETSKRKQSKKRFDSDQDEDDASDDDDDEPAVAFGADSTAASRKRRNKAAKSVVPAQEEALATGTAGDDDDQEANQGDDKAKIEAAMKKAVAAQKPKRQMPKMDVERLLSAKGLPKLLEMAERFKPSDKASTAHKLNQLMALYELWSHVMYPSMAFNDVIRRIETLGSKRPVQSFMRKLRLGENPGPWDITVKASDDEGGDHEEAIQQNRSSNKENPLFEADDDTGNDGGDFDEFLSQALDQIEGDNNEDNSRKKQPSPDEVDEDLNELDAFLDNLNKPIRDELL